MLKGAIVGYGFISSNGHLPAYLERSRTQDDIEIVAIADICEARRRAAKLALPHARIYEDHLSLLRAESAQLDFIDISTPPRDHAAIAHDALDHGLHVLCEKPLTCTVKEAASLLEHAQRARRVIFPCHNYKHAPVVKAVRKVIDSGSIGKVQSLTLNTFRNTHAKGIPEWKTDWRRSKRWSGGGIAMDHGSHTFYLAFDWMNAYPTSITAHMYNLQSERYDTEDNFSAVLTFPNGVAHTHLTWTAGVRKVIYTIQGEKGAITVNDSEMEVALMKTSPTVSWQTEKQTVTSDWMDASHVGWFNSLFDQFLNAINQEDFVGKEAKEAFLCIQLIENAYRSAKEKSLEQNLQPEGRQRMVAAGEYGLSTSAA